MKFLITAGALALALAVATSAPAGEYKAGDVTVVNPWARATPGVPRNGGAYLTIKGGVSDDELIGVATAVAKRAELHGHKQENGVMKMRQVKGVKVPASGMIILKPSSLHVMLIKLNQALKQGKSFPMTLRFAKAGEVTVQVKIMGVGAMEAGKSHQHAGHGLGYDTMAPSIDIAVHRISADGIGDVIGTIKVRPMPHGVKLTPNLKGLSTGLHAMHIHENPDCRSGMKGSKNISGLAAGGHFDPAGGGGAHGHGGGHGHKPAGDLPQLKVDTKGLATKAIEVKSLTMHQLMGRSIIIHSHAEMPRDPAKANGGGERIACGIVRR